MFDKEKMPKLDDMGRVPRRFTCIRCNKKAVDHQAGYTQTLKDGTKLETENIDLCNKCFKKTQSESRQTDFIREKLEKKELNEDDLKRIATDKNFKRELYENGGLIHKKGHLKEKNRQLLEQLLAKSKSEDKK